MEARRAELEAALERRRERDVRGGVLCRGVEMQEERSSVVVWR
jgi:hypothetical protein